MLTKKAHTIKEIADRLRQGRGGIHRIVARTAARLLFKHKRNLSRRLVGSRV